MFAEFSTSLRENKYDLNRLKFFVNFLLDQLDIIGREQAHSAVRAPSIPPPVVHHLDVRDQVLRIEGQLGGILRKFGFQLTAFSSTYIIPTVSTATV